MLPVCAAYAAECTCTFFFVCFFGCLTIRCWQVCVPLYSWRSHCRSGPLWSQVNHQICRHNIQNHKHYNNKNELPNCVSHVNRVELYDDAGICIFFTVLQSVFSWAWSPFLSFSWERSPLHHKPNGRAKKAMGKDQARNGGVWPTRKQWPRFFTSLCWRMQCLCMFGGIPCFLILHTVIVQASTILWSGSIVSVANFQLTSTWSFPFREILIFKCPVYENIDNTETSDVWTTCHSQR